METIKVGIYHKDGSYARALARGLARESRTMSFCILNDYCDGAGCGLILTDCESQDSNAVCLCGNQEDDNIAGEPPYRLFRYKSSTDMINDLLFVYFQITGRTTEFKSSGLTPIITVFSDCGGAGATLISLSLCIMLNRLYGSRCLYVNLCPINDSFRYIEGGRESSMLKLLYYLRREERFPIGTFISSHEEFDTVDTDVVNRHFADLTPELMGSFMRRIEEIGKYDFVVIDVGNHLCRQNSVMIANSQCVVRISAWGRENAGSYAERIQESIDELTKGTNVIRVINFADDSLPQEDESSVLVSPIEEGIEGSLLQVKKCLDNNYGVEIAELAKRAAEGLENEEK